LSKEIKKLASETALYGLGTMLPRMLNFFLVPIQTRAFPKEDYAAISELYGYVAFLNIIFLFGMETAYFRFSNKENAQPEKIFRIAQTAVMLISVAFTGIFLLSTQTLTSVLHSPNSSVIVWLALTLLIDAVVAIPFAQLRLRKKALAFAIYKIINVCVLVGLNLYFLKYSGKPIPGIEFVFIANFIANATYIVFLFKDLISWRPLFDKIITPEMFRYSYPLVITGLAGMTNEMFSRIALDNWMPNDFYPGRSPKYMQGVFAACYKFSAFMTIAIQAFRFASEPFFFSKASDKNSPALFARVNSYFVLFASLIMVGICLNLEWLKYFVDAESWQGLGIVPILLFGSIFFGIYLNMSVWFKLTDQTHFGTIITIVGAIFTIVFNYLLIPQYGIIGSSIATLLVYFSMAALCYFIGQRFFPVPYSVGKDLLLLIGACAIVFLNWKIEIQDALLSITVRGITSLAIVVGALLVVRKNFRQS
jgi:O-antigen/teichoic acid export membrane protein